MWQCSLTGTVGEFRRARRQQLGRVRMELRKIDLQVFHRIVTQRDDAYCLMSIPPPTLIIASNRNLRF